MNLKRNKKGFTLVELIVVLIIIGILLAMVIPNLTGYIDKARMKDAEVGARSAYMAAMTLRAEDYAAGTTTCTSAEIAKLTGLDEDDIGVSLDGADAGKVKTVSYDNGTYTCTFNAAGEFSTAKN